MGSIPVRTCTVDGCEDKYLAKGLCGKHYARVKRTGKLESSFRESCSVEGCESKHRGKGFCSKHYSRFTNNGTLEIGTIIGNDEKRFWSKVEKTDTCWLWRGALQPNGYGYFKLAGKNLKAHRYSYYLAHGEEPGAFFVCHTCDNPRCVNPEHLWLGTQLDNIKDMLAKGRNYIPLAEECNLSKLSKKDVVQIRDLLNEKITQKEIAKRFNVTQSAISAIKLGRTWSLV